MACKPGLCEKTNTLSSTLEFELIHILLRGNHMDVNYDNAASMKIAISTSNIDILQLILDKSPS